MDEFDYYSDTHHSNRSRAGLFIGIAFMAVGALCICSTVIQLLMAFGSPDVSARDLSTAFMNLIAFAGVGIILEIIGVVLMVKNLLSNRR